MLIKICYKTHFQLNMDSYLILTAEKTNNEYMAEKPLNWPSPLEYQAALIELCLPGKPALVCNETTHYMKVEGDDENNNSDVLIIRVTENVTSAEHLVTHLNEKLSLLRQKK